MSPNELIINLKNQHILLKEDLTLALENFDLISDKKDLLVISALAKFKVDLLNHLALENKELYPDFLDKKIKMGADVNETKKFIFKMEEIAKVVISFLNKYETPELLKASSSTFKDELLEIVDVLNIRIQTEEEGIFDLYLLM